MVGMGNAVELAAAVVAIGGAAVGAQRAAVARYRRTVGSRRSLAQRLDRLAAGVTREYVEAMFGPPAFRSSFDTGRTSLVFVTRHAYVQVVFDDATAAVAWFGITASDPRFSFRTRWLTAGELDVQLGRSTFDDVDTPAAGTFLSIGARRFACARAYWFGNPGNYQHYVLAFNDAGVGTWSVHEGTPPAAAWADGVMQSDEASDPEGFGDVTPEWLDRAFASATVNTLLVVGPGIDVPSSWPGVDLDAVRLLRRRRHLSESRSRQRP